MKNLVLAFFLLFSLSLSYAGGCSYNALKSFEVTAEGKMARLTFYVDLSQPSPYCEALSKCQTFQWYKHDGTQFVLIPGETNNFYETYDTGVYRLMACGELNGGVAVIKTGEVYRNKVVKPKVISDFSVYPNPSSTKIVNLLVPTNSISSETSIFKIELFDVAGAMLMFKNNLSFGTKSVPLDLTNNKSGIYILKVTCGEEVRVLKIMLS